MTSKKLDQDLDHLCNLNNEYKNLLHDIYAEAKKIAVQARKLQTGELKPKKIGDCRPNTLSEIRAKIEQTDQLAETIIKLENQLAQIIEALD